MTSPIRWMRSFSIRLRMQGAIVMVMGLFALVGVAGLLGGRHLAEINSSFMHHSLKEVHDAGDVRTALGSVRRHEKDMVIHYEDSAAVGRYRASWNTELKSARAGLEALLQGAEDEDNPIARTAIKEIDAYVAASNRVLDQIEQGNYDNALAADKMLARAKSHIAEAEKGVDAIDRIIDAEAQQTRADFDASMQHTLWAYLGVLGLATVLVVPLTVLNSASITGPINQAHDMALAIAEGNLGASVCTDGQDEIAELLRALQKMQSALHGIVGQVRESAGSIQTASAEVAAGNTDLSHRTEQTASHLQQTASSMAQLTTTVRQSADAAAQANQLAASAAGTAQRGGDVVGQVVSTMDEINQSSKRIADIIGTIDGIAFQTNILALNAAVEAARAGEQGRGFAVVASEVRSLAQRSTEAAREIKALIGTSVDKVEAGARLVQAAGSTMTEIVGSVQRVSDIIGEISAAAAEQSGGIGLVSGAVSSLDQMTQQNAALVEQSAAAAESLRSQAERLTEVVGRFRT